MRITIVVPTLNPGPVWKPFTAALLENLRNLRIAPTRVLVIDSHSDDPCRARAIEAGFRTVGIEREQFDHGGTRQSAVEGESDADVLVFLTQDAILVRPDAIRTLLAAFDHPDIGAAYGRQLPRRTAGGIEAHARLFNYPSASRVRGMEDAATLGFKSIFSSNALCAFRRDALASVGGFPLRAIASEEVIVIAAMHMAGWRSAYVADAAVYHSHAYSVKDEFKRYFDVGVTHARNPMLTEVFGIANGEGRRFVVSEIRYLLHHRPLQLPAAMLRTLTKYAGYRLGRHEAQLSMDWRRRLSLNQTFWSAEGQLISMSDPEPLEEAVSFGKASGTR
jgi:rhamnosyltransferase